MDVELFDYFLPTELIAQKPAVPRDSSRLLISTGGSNKFIHKSFKDIVDFFDDGDVLIYNDSRVIPSRAFGFHLGKRVEVFVLSTAGGDFRCLIKPSKRIKIGERITLEGGLEIEVFECFGDGEWGAKSTEKDFLKRLEEIGHPPLPPYIKRNYNGDDRDDAETYQTVFAREKGSVAAPTAGLHFTEEIMENLEKRGVLSSPVTLHVGLGTFKPIKTKKIHDHRMHQEYLTVSGETANLINEQKSKGKRIFAVGTTTLRALESSANEGVVAAKKGFTDIFIKPGFDFRVTDGLITNFHTPKSTLFVLVCAFGGIKTMKKAYEEAILKKYRLLSYGDGMLILR